MVVAQLLASSFTSYSVDGKITRYAMLIGSRGRAFSMIQGKNYSVLIGRWYAKVISATMVFQFAEVDENSIQDSMVSSKNENTRKKVPIIG